MALAVPPVGPWQQAEVVAVHAETATATTFSLRLSEPHDHVPGQHYVLRLTAPDGYRAQRSYSVATAPGGDTIDVTVELLPDGEVSTFLHEVVVVGDTLEVRGPIGGYFAWDGESPALGVGGGAGVVPLMAMLRTARSTGREDAFRLLVSARTPDSMLYSAELPGPTTSIVWTRSTPPGAARPAGRLTAADLEPLLDDERTVFVCGTPLFCDAATGLLLDLGVQPGRVLVERFGPTG